MNKNIYYVYIHTRLDTGEVFYVGKGNGYRAFDKSGRNIWWNRIANKTEWISSIVQDNMSEDDAYLLEMWLIAKFRHNGVKLCNISDGGEGGQGVQSTTSKKTYCSNGMSFESGRAAAEWLRINGFPNARQGHIASCARGERRKAYGYAWSYVEVPIDDGIGWKEAIGISNSKPVNCSNGMRFPSCAAASDWVRSGGFPKATSIRISSVARSNSGSAYGFSWWYDDGNPYTHIPVEKPVECVGHRSFKRLKDAAEWVSENTGYKAQGRPISEAAQGKYKQAYGFTWRYL